MWQLGLALDEFNHIFVEPIFGYMQWGPVQMGSGTMHGRCSKSLQIRFIKLMIIQTTCVRSIFGYDGLFYFSLQVYNLWVLSWLATMQIA